MAKTVNLSVLFRSIHQMNDRPAPDSRKLVDKDAAVRVAPGYVYSIAEFCIAIVKQVYLIVHFVRRLCLQLDMLLIFD